MGGTKGMTRIVKDVIIFKDWEEEEDRSDNWFVHVIGVTADNVKCSAEVKYGSKTEKERDDHYDEIISKKDDLIAALQKIEDEIVDVEDEEDK
jgi:hypothetical protein